MECGGAPPACPAREGWRAGPPAAPAAAAGALVGWCGPPWLAAVLQGIPPRPACQEAAASARWRAAPGSGTPAGRPVAAPWHQEQASPCRHAGTGGGHAQGAALPASGRPAGACPCACSARAAGPARGRSGWRPARRRRQQKQSQPAGSARGAARRSGSSTCRSGELAEGGPKRQSDRFRCWASLALARCDLHESDRGRGVNVGGRQRSKHAVAVMSCGRQLAPPPPPTQSAGKTSKCQAEAPASCTAMHESEVWRALVMHGRLIVAPRSTPHALRGRAS